MKKNISINISGIIFHIEEDAFEKLRNYMDAINRYFSTFDGSQEIIEDIESRIAEIFLGRLQDDKQVITPEDVDALITTMGSIKDFQAVEEPDMEGESMGTEGSFGSEWKETGTKKLYRDENRKLLGGVCAGLAHYFKTDPLWIRLIAILLLLGYGVVVIVYIIMWIALPAKDYPEDKKQKKMFRDPENKVIAGVSSGVAAYFAIDVTIIRLLFVIFTFVGGTGLFVYIVLWIILPEAKTVSDRVQMAGDPVTLSNIEANVKKSLNVKDGEENLLVKILLFPFRLIAIILTGLGKLLGPLMAFLVELIRIVAGVILIVTGLVIAFTMIVALGALFGIFSTELWFPGQPFVIIDMLQDTFPVLTVAAAFLLIAVPTLFLILLGVSVLAKRITFNAATGWTLFAIFIISVIVLSVNVPRIVYQFREDGEHQVVQEYTLENKTPVLELRETGLEGYAVTSLQLRGHEGPGYKLIENFEAQGKTRLDAEENARMVTYQVDLKDSIFTFDSNIQFKEGALFRAQRLDMILYIPYDQPFVMDEDMRHIIRNTSGFHYSDDHKNTWQISRDKGLECLTCPVYRRRTSSHRTIEKNGRSYREFTFDHFEALKSDHVFTIDMIKDPQYRVSITGKPAIVNNIDVFSEGDRLYVKYNGHSFRDYDEISRNDVNITIFTPSISEIDLAGVSKLNMHDFTLRSLDLELTGASYARLTNINIDNIDIELSGTSELEIEGEGSELQAELSGVSQLNAYDYQVTNAQVETNGASSAKVYVTHHLEYEEAFASKVKYRGTPRVVAEEK